MQEQVSLNYNITSDVHKQITSMEDKDREKDALTWLSAPDPSTNYENARTSRHASTGSWFLESKDFAQWKVDANSLIWLYGKAGCGKTILSSTILAEGLSQRSGSDGSCLAYFFFDFNDARKQRSNLMIRSIIKQLHSQSYSVRVELDALFSSCSDGQRSMDHAALMTILQGAIRKSTRTSIILDALDECLDLDVLTFIETIVGWGVPTLHLLCTSRWLSTIKETMQNFDTPSHLIQIKSEVISEDISEYITHTVQNDPQLGRWRGLPDVEEDIRVALTQGADGM